MRALILLCAIAVAYASQECGPNAHWESCGTACPLTCDNYQNPPLVCILRCDIGCQCDEGYVKSSDGKCVRPEQCPAKAVLPVCGKNQQWSECGTPCPLTCEIPYPQHMCPAMCVMGCFCKPGYLRYKDGQCVKFEECQELEMKEMEDEMLKQIRDNQAPVTEKSCTDKPDKGVCLAYVPSWYYDVEEGKCKRFIYGGCQGNGNRYRSEKECIKYCQGTSKQQSSAEACDLPAETGVCRGSFPRYYFDRTTGQCERFVYGGCGGNDNNFLSVDECQRTCAASAPPTVCLAEKVTGPCRARFVRYFYNQETKKCERFIYGGCQGNSNNFETLESCHAVCVEE